MDVILEIILIVSLGLILGSFTTAISYRVPLGVSWGAKRSSCPVCHTNLGVFDLIPVLSWCLGGGKCRYCKTKISIRYPLIELVSLILCLSVYVAYGLNIQSMFVISAVPFLFALFLIDIKHLILPNQLVAVLFLIGAVRLVYFWSLNGFMVDDGLEVLVHYVFAVLVFSFVSWGAGFVTGKILKKESLGFGDVKFFGVSGLWLGMDYLPVFMIISGGLAVFIALIWRYKMKSELFPFGPALISAFFILLFYQGILLS
jgi:leader peptidase (prepilin peptidase)/N-methyltransferase